MRFLIIFLSILLCVELFAYQSRVESVIVKTRAPSNKVVTFWYVEVRISSDDCHNFY